MLSAKRRMKNYYQILDVPTTAEHEEIKRAFRRAALARHPDRNPHLANAEELFKELIEAYDTLSDVHKRARYDLHVLQIRSAVLDHGLTHEELARSETESVLDTPTDDTLEEYVVGNTPPPDTTFGTLFRDLERTENFLLIRDGKQAFFTKQYAKAAAIFRRAESLNPRNILILYYLARSQEVLGRLADAEKLLRAALSIGEARVPPNHCRGVRRALLALYKRRGKTLRARWLERENRALTGYADESDQMVREMNRAMARLQAEQLSRQIRATGKPREQKQIEA